MAFASSAPFPMFAGINGLPLQSGQLFFGIPDGNPETDPIVVYWDQLLTQPAAQPVRTLNGLPSRNGSPAQLYFANDHSVTVKDRYGRLLYYARRASDYTLAASLARSDNAGVGAGMIGYDPGVTYPPGTVGAALQDGGDDGSLEARLANPAQGARLVAFQRGAAASVARTSFSKHADTLTSYDFLTSAQIADVQSGAAAIDVTSAFQAFITESAYRHGQWLKGKYRISAPIVFDPSKSYRISGENFDINASTGTGILNVANSTAFVFDNSSPSNFNPDIVLSNFYITGNNAGNAQHGIYAKRTPIHVRDAYIVNSQHGVWMERGYASSMENCIIAQNYQDGVFLDREANQITLLHVIANSNGRSAGGYAGIDIRGTANNENLAVTLIGCDTTANGQASGDGSGVIIQHSRGVNIIGHYGEFNKTFGIFADISVKNLSAQGGFHLDEENRFIDVDGLFYLQNEHRGNTAGLSKLTVQAAGGRDCYLRGNTYGGPFGTTRTFTNGAGERREQFNSAPPAVAGPNLWNTGDIIWHNTPAAGGNVGWVCIAGGPTGLWKAFGTIAL